MPAVSKFWLPTTLPASRIEIPARAPGMAANLWVHVAADTTNWTDFSKLGTFPRQWERSPTTLAVAMEAGDIPVASIASWGISGMQREEQGVFDTDAWGMALDFLSPLPPDKLQPDRITFSGEIATFGMASPGGIWFLVDILVLRPSLIPAVPAPYGTYPPPSHRFDQYVSTLNSVKDLATHQPALLGQLRSELDELISAAGQQPDAQLNVDQQQATMTKTAKVMLAIANRAGVVNENDRGAGAQPQAPDNLRKSTAVSTRWGKKK